MVGALYIVGAILLYLAGLFTKNFLPTYANEKGKNLATKEDIEVITKKIEEVKSEIEIGKHRKLSLGAERQKALLDFYRQFFVWLDYATHVSLTPIDDDVKAHALEVMRKLDELYLSTVAAQANLEVFYYNDEELIELARESIVETIQLSTFVKVSLINLKTLTLQVQEIDSSLLDNKVQEMERLRHEHFLKFSELSHQRLDSFKAVIVKSSVFVKNVSSRLV